MKQNFIIIMADQLRADHLGCYGNDIVQTPNIDKLAKSGTRFENFYVSNPICQPNRACLATGQLTSVNGCRQNGIPLALDSTTYADVLRASGYRTGLMGKAHFQNVSPIQVPPPDPQGAGDTPPKPYHVSRRTQRAGPEYTQEIRTEWINNPDRVVPLPYYGFDHLHLCIGHGDQVEGHYSAWLRDKLKGSHDPRGRANALDASDSHSPQIWRTALPEALYPTTYVGEQACAFLKEDNDQPFLLVASFPDPHHPFTPPGQYFDMYDPKDIPLPKSFYQRTDARENLPRHIQRIYEIGAEKPDAYWPFHADESTTRQIIALNYGTISMIDDWVGNVVKTLKNSGKSEDTTIIFMSDHGDYMGDHGTVLKHGLHSHGLIRVPLIWADPAAPTEEISYVQGSAIDFAPTLLQQAGLQIPAGMQGRNIRAAAVDDIPVLIEDSGLCMASSDGLTASNTLVHKGSRLTVFEGSDFGELYDLKADPHELENLWTDGASQGQKATMFKKMIDRKINLRDTTLYSTHQA